jgi:hypothetical protein
VRAYQRLPNVAEAKAAGELIEKHGALALTRVLLNSNEYLVVE